MSTGSLNRDSKNNINTRKHKADCVPGVFKMNQSQWNLLVFEVFQL